MAAAGCLQCAGACASAFRLQQRECAALALAAGTEGGEAARAPGREGQEEGRGFRPGGAAGAARPRVRLLGTLTRGASTCARWSSRRQQRNPGRQELLRKLPSLESFAAMSTQELIDAMQAVAAVLEKLSDVDGDGAARGCAARARMEVAREDLI